MNKSTRYSPEVRERAVRLVFEHQGEHGSQWAAISSIASKIGCTPETLRKWVRRAECDQSMRGGITSAFTTIQVECHLGLGVKEERQLFHDLNNLGKRVDASLALKFDSANPINVFIKEVLIDDDEVLDYPNLDGTPATMTRLTE